MPSAFSLYNTLTKNAESFEPIEAGKVGIYVCGMTVYDHIHIGHARAMIVFDSFVRYLRSAGWDVNFVRNFTDVDDKIINRANEAGEDPLAYAQKYIDAFHKDGDALGLLRPDKEPRVSTSMEAIFTLIRSLLERGHAYKSEGSVWFDVASCGDYGKLSRQKVDELRSADESAGKKNSADFALWKAVKPGEPSWESPWGAGRPGWHIECSAMAAECIGETIDIHGGGLDLVFPHHENEIAQSECGHGKPYARYWMHNGLLNMAAGQKMGKSLGNVINVRAALEDYPAEVLRLYYLQNHYRSPLLWDDQALPTALAMMCRLYEALEVAQSLAGNEPAATVVSDLGDDAKAVWQLGNSFADKLDQSLAQDFNTAQPIGHLFELARAINRFSNHKKAKKRGGPVVQPAIQGFKKVADALGLFQQEPAQFFVQVREKCIRKLGITATDVENLLDERKAARAAKDWDRADEIRAELDAKSIQVMDSPDGVTWRVSIQ